MVLLTVILWFMLPRLQRLTAREFAIVFDKARVLRHPLLQVRCYRHGEEPEKTGSGPPKSLERATRAAFVAPKKLGNAVARNAIRRRVRERYRILRGQLIKSHRWDEALENCDLVFFATSQCAAASQEQIDESLSLLLKRAAKS